MRERFNEELSYSENVKSRGPERLEKKQLQTLDTDKKSIKQTPSQVTVSAISKIDLVSRVTSSLIRKRRNTANATQLQDSTPELAPIEKRDKAFDGLSAITAERLKKFNEIQGTVAGTAL